VFRERRNTMGNGPGTPRARVRGMDDAPARHG
jgi:hypothetical protein